MNNTDEEFQRLLQLALDGHLNVEDVVRLRELSSGNPDRIDQLVEHFMLDSMLRSEAGEQAVASLVDLVAGAAGEASPRLAPRTTAVAEPRWQIMAAVFTGLAASLLAALLLVRGGPEATPVAPTADNAIPREVAPTVALLVQTADAKWGGANQSPFEFSPGPLELIAGMAELRFYSGATVFLEGPVELELVSVSQAILRKGRLRAHVPPQAEGFTVVAPNVRLVDRGTEFGMVVEDDASSQVHVFDGRVDLYPSDVASDARPHSLTTGESVVITEQFRLRPADPTTYPSSESLAQHRSERQELWRRHSAELCQDPRLVFYFRFDELGREDKVVDNRAADPEISASIVGCDTVSGRWSGQTAVGLSRRSDRLRIRVPGQYQQATFVCWMRLDALPGNNQALLMTDSYDTGNPHWQISRDGRLHLGVGHPEASVRGTIKTSSNPVFDQDALGHWMHVATVYDSMNRSVVYYVDGKSVGSETLGQGIPLKIGMAEIGNWLRPRETGEEPVRNLVGRIDEFALFGAALDKSSIQEMYEAGRP